MQFDSPAIGTEYSSNIGIARLIGTRSTSRRPLPTPPCTIAMTAPDKSNTGAPLLPLVTAASVL